MHAKLSPPTSPVLPFLLTTNPKDIANTLHILGKKKEMEDPLDVCLVDDCVYSKARPSGCIRKQIEKGTPASASLTNWPSRIHRFTIFPPLLYIMSSLQIDPKQMHFSGINVYKLRTKLLCT